MLKAPLRPGVLGPVSLTTFYFNMSVLSIGMAALCTVLLCFVCK